MTEEYIRGVFQNIISYLKTVQSVAEQTKEATEAVTNTLEALNDTVGQLSETVTALNTAVDTINQENNFLNPTHLGIVIEGDTTFDQNVVLCNVTDNNVTVTVTGAGDEGATTVVLTPGWNPIVVKSITGATANTLAYGW